ncbi:Fe(3+)-hydroxamate ABC transporter permease FhuB [Roseibium suaedae]|uniref:Iron complex transport system permease protein n=1 Tax=Roseibium suaedae TaxID=735517 RepID=A0A1M7L9H1_9HYPH|nr:Fe(3+)-hydroxamate ABC transporter permease FhuB [Roseibium suaedae]SHM74209.1 iron complex transport system permease protein [Roseibium suaedae]
MAEPVDGWSAGRSAYVIAPFVLGLLLLVTHLQATGLNDGLPWRATSPDSLASVQLLSATLPRFCVAILAGALLGLSATLLQQGLRNPLAEPGTTGLLSASRLCVAGSLVWFPALSGSLALPVLAGTILALVIVIGLSMRQAMSPLFLVLNGLVLALLCDAVTSVLILTRYEDLADLLLWQAGSLVQNNWHVTRLLLAGLVLLAFIIVVLRKPLSMLDLEDTVSGSLGLSPKMVRLLAVGLAAVATALVTAHIGLLAFVGLAGATLAKLLGARRFLHRAALSSVLSAGLLLVTDQVLQRGEGIMAIPAGTVCALFAAPLLLFLLHSGRTRTSPGTRFELKWRPQRFTGRALLSALVLLLVIVTCLALFLGRSDSSFVWASFDNFPELLPWRLPRVVAALGAGSMIALSGFLMQRLTGNSLASPEMIGVSSGATLVMLPVIFFLPPLSREQTMLVAAVGALIFLIIALRLARRSHYAPERLLITGLAITALSGSLLSTVIYFGDIRLTRLLGWLSGSTYSVTGFDASVAVLVLAITLAVLPFLRRWLEILPIGESVSVALGVEIKIARFWIILLVALQTGVATVLIGPVTFVGLVVPHLVRLCGLRRPMVQAAGCALGGAALMVAADWTGRMIAFPWDVPAGLIACAFGALAFGVVVSRRSQ